MKKMLCKIPHIIHIENFLTNEECDNIIKHGEPLLTDSNVVNVDTGFNEKMDSFRTSKDCWFDHDNPLVVNLHDKIEKEIGISKKRFEALTMLRYDIGGRYVPHWDYFEDVIPTYQDIIGRVGNRVGTVIVYLNDVEEGGHTTFNKLNLSVEPRKGSMLYFRYDYKNKSDNANTMHAGEPVIKGHKYIVTTWIREFPFSL